MADVIRVEGLKELVRDLRKLAPEVAKELRKEIKVVARKVASEASSSAQSFSRTGAYAASLKPYVTTKGASVGSTLPQAGVVHFGGTIQPRGVPITFPPRPVVSDALDRSTDRIVNELGDAIERAAEHAGWH